MPHAAFATLRQVITLLFDRVLAQLLPQHIQQHGSASPVKQGTQTPLSADSTMISKGFPAEVCDLCARGGSCGLSAMPLCGRYDRTVRLLH